MTCKKCTFRINAITNRNDDIEIIEWHLTSYHSDPFLLNLSEFPTCCILCQFTIFVYMANMFYYIRTR